MRRPNIDAIRRRVAAATPGTWKVGSRFGLGNLGSSTVVMSGKHPPIVLDRHRNGRADAAFIAHARQDIPALLAEIDRLRAVVERSPAGGYEYGIRDIGSGQMHRTSMTEAEAREYMNPAGWGGASPTNIFEIARRQLGGWEPV